MSFDTARGDQNLPAYYSTLDPDPSNPRYFETSKEAEDYDRSLEQNSNMDPLARYFSGPKTQAELEWDTAMSGIEQKAEIGNLFGPPTENDKIWDLLGENYERNEKEKNERGVQGIFGDPDLIKIYRENIQSNPIYNQLELTVRDIPLNMEWVADSVFGSSPSRASYDIATNTVRVAETLKGDTESVVGAISFELQNAGARHDFEDVNKRAQHGVKSGVFDYTGVPMFNPSSVVPLNQQLANARQIVEMERVEYQNVIRIEKAARAVGKTSAFTSNLNAGVSSRWSSFAKYLEDQCASGHYANLDPNVKSPSWNGWRFVKASEWEDKDPLA